MAEVGKAEVRVDAFDKATGRTKYYEDLMPRDALYVRIKHATIAHGFVKSVDTSAAEQIPGVVKVLTCFRRAGASSSPRRATPGPWSPAHQDVADRQPAEPARPHTMATTSPRWSSQKTRWPPCRASGAHAGGVRGAALSCWMCRRPWSPARPPAPRGATRTTSWPKCITDMPKTESTIHGAAHVGQPGLITRSGGLLRHPAGAALPHREPRLLRL